MRDPSTSPLDLVAGRPGLRATRPGVRDVAARVAVVGMIAATAGVLGQNASMWLVPPYLLLMGWLLLVPSRRDPAADEPARAEATPPAPAEEVPDLPGSTPAAVAEVLPTLVEEASPPKSRKGKGRAKAKGKEKGVAEPSPATWVRVGPGKFVRVEGGEVATPSEAEAEAVAANATPAAIVPADEAVTAAPEGPPSPGRPIETDEVEGLDPRGSCSAQVAPGSAVEPVPDVREPGEEAEISGPCHGPAEYAFVESPPTPTIVTAEARPGGNPDAPRARPASWIGGLARKAGISRTRKARSAVSTRARRTSCRRPSDRVGASPRVMQSRAPPSGGRGRRKRESGRVRGDARGPSPVFVGTRIQAICRRGSLRMGTVGSGLTEGIGNPCSQSNAAGWLW